MIIAWVWNFQKPLILMSSAHFQINYYGKLSLSTQLQQVVLLRPINNVLTFRSFSHTHNQQVMLI